MTWLVLLSLPGTVFANHNLIEHISTGPTDPNSPAAIQTGQLADDGSAAFFVTSQKLDATDIDSTADVYQGRYGVTTRVSAGEINGNAGFDAALGGSSSDGARVWFATNEQLVPGDTDGSRDVYERYQGHTYLVSTGPTDSNLGTLSFFGGASADGSRVYFVTAAPMTAADTDACFDIYERSGGTTSLVTAEKADCGPDPLNMSMKAYADTVDGPAVLFETTQRMVPEDAGSGRDVYEWVGGVTHLLSQGPDTSDPAPASQFVGFSAATNETLIYSSSKLTADDADSRSDLFLYRDGTLSRVSKGPVGGNGDFDAFGNFGVISNLSVDGNHAYFTTSEQLVTSDTDGTSGLYEYDVATGSTRLIGRTDGGAFARASDDGSRVFFGSYAQLVPADTDSSLDLYEDHAGVVTQVSVGNVPSDSRFEATSAGGSRVFFRTHDPLVASDTNGTADLYERFNGTNYLLSRNDQGLAGGTADIVNVADLTTDGTKVLFAALGRLLPSDSDSVADLYLATRTPDAYARPKAATPINVAFVPAYAACASPNRVHAAPLSFNACAPPAQVSTFLTLGTPDANGAAAKSVASLRLLVIPGNPSTPANEAEARYEVSITDVRNSSDLTDYTGALKLDAALQITDRNNPDVDGGSPNATGSQPSFPVIVPCASTADTTVGSTCSITTTANTIAPGATVEGKRAIWETGQVRVWDGGADGNPGTVDGDGLFLVQGVFIP